MTTPNFAAVYAHLLGWTFTGLILGRTLPKTTPSHLGKFLFWIGVPVSIVAFLRHATLSFSLWIAPATAWVAILAGAGLAWCITRWQAKIPWLGQINPSSQQSPSLSAAHSWSTRTQGSFLLTSMVGNTGYIGFPVSLALVGPQYFAWALFYDALGTTLGAYGLGIAIAAHCSSHTYSRWQIAQTLFKNPALWSFAVGVIGRDVPLPVPVESGLRGLAWGMVSLSLVLVGMRLSQLSSFKSIQPALLSIGIKMVLVPIVLGVGLKLLGVTGLVHRAILLQMAMPPAFATLVIAEAYELDQELAVTALVAGCLGLLLLLPVWLWLFGG